MPLNCDNKILDRAEFHRERQRCADKREALDIFLRMKHEQENTDASQTAPTMSRTFRSKISKGPENRTTHKPNTSHYDCKKEQYNTAIYDLDTKYGYR